MTFDDLKALIGLTFREPETAARQLMSAGIPLPARWMGLMIAVSVSAILAWFSAQLFPLPEGEAMPALSMTAQPLLMASVQAGAILLAAGLMSAVGRMFGGQGRFEDALLLAVWIEVVLLLVQVAQVVVSLLVPAVAGILGILAIAMFLWLTVQFTKALHDFRSGAKVFMGLIATAFAVGFLLSFIAAALGILPEISQ